MAFPAVAAPGDRHKEGREWHVYDGAKWWRLIGCAIVADATERNALTDRTGRANGSLCVQEDDGTLWVWDNAGSAWRSSASGFVTVADLAARDALSAAGAVRDGNLVALGDTGQLYARVGGAWVQAWTPPTDETILRKLSIDPGRALGAKMEWRDDRLSMRVVASESDLFTIPTSHLATGKLAYVTGAKELFEFVASPTSATNSIADWDPVGRTIPEYARASDLPQPTASVAVKEGELALVRFHSDGTTPLNSVHIARVLTPGSTAITWVPIATNVTSKGTRAGADVADPQPDDLQITTEAGHTELKMWDQTAGVWITIYAEDQVKQWIAAGNLFTGTVQETGGGVTGAIDAGTMPAQSALGATDKGHYWIWVGSAGYVLPTNSIGGSASSIEGQSLNKGDWIQVAEPSTGVYRYTVVPGDLLSKSRGDSIYGLHTWRAGAYEQGTLVVHQGKIYRATGAVTSTDAAPDTAGAPWTAIALTAGVTTVSADANLPNTAPSDKLYLVLNSTRGGNRPALQLFDTAGATWTVVGGGAGSGGAAALPLAIIGGHPMHEVGCPIGSVMAWPSDTLPAGWLLCDGAAFDPNLYPQLRLVLGRAAVPNLRGQFLRGATTNLDRGFPSKPWTTGMPRAGLTMDHQGGHVHQASRTTHGSQADGTGDPNWEQVHIGDNRDPKFQSTGNPGLSTEGDHVHSLIGGDTETAPNHVLLNWIIKAGPATIQID